MSNTAPPDDGDLRRLLDDAVSDVHPEGGPDEIRARARRPSAMRWLPITVAAAAATAVVIAGGAWLAQRHPGSNPPAAGPGTTDTHGLVGPAAGHPVDATVYYVGATAAGPRLFPEARRVADATDSDLQVAVDEAADRHAEGPRLPERVPGPRPHRDRDRGLGRRHDRPVRRRAAARRAWTRRRPRPPCSRSCGRRTPPPRAPSR